VGEGHDKNQRVTDRGISNGRCYFFLLSALFRRIHFFIYLFTILPLFVTGGFSSRTPLLWRLWFRHHNTFALRLRQPTGILFFLFFLFFLSLFLPSHVTHFISALCRFWHELCEFAISINSYSMSGGDGFNLSLEYSTVRYRMIWEGLECTSRGSNSIYCPGV